MLVRVFGIFGIILGAAYFNEGVAILGLLSFALSQKANTVLVSYLLYLTWDFLFGTALIVAGIGVLFFKEWARIMWLGLMPALVLVHLGIIVSAELLGKGSGAFYLVWTGMVIFVAAASWWFLTSTKTRARFSRPQEEPATTEE
ncbi:MAG TPA: hypothetical protein VFO99_04350 [Pyrinomonadaceae bacterium]|nr:hypothetical protein [Pyrinomonadaceae bacterium]